MSLARAKPRAIRVAVRCDTVVVLTVGHGTTVLQYNESWVYDGTAYVKIPATLHKISEEGAELSVSGMKFLLSEWRGKLRNKETGKDIHLPSNGHVVEQEVFMSGVGCYRCKLADPKPFPHLYVNYADFYLKLDGYRTPFKGEKWKVFSCKGEKVDEEWFLLKALENSPPLDHNLQGCSIKIRLEDFQELKEHARELQATGRVTPPPPGLPIDVSPPATPGRNSPVVPMLSDSASSISSELGHHLRGLSQGNLSQLSSSDHDLPVLSGTMSGLSDGRITGLTFSMSRESAGSLGESSVGGSSESGDYTPRERLGFVRRVSSRAASSPGSAGSLSPQERLDLEVGAFVQQLDGEFNLGERSGTWWRALFTKLGQHPLAASAMQDVLVGQGSPSSIY